MKVIVAGGRNIHDYKIIKEAIEAFPVQVSEVVSGGAKGVDELGEMWGKENGIDVITFYAKWDELGKGAGPIRNQEMAEYVGAQGGLCAVWDGKSPGTKDMINRALRMGLTVKVKIIRAGS